MSRSKKLWRYMSFGRFVWMLEKNALWMAHIDALDDQWEGWVTYKEVELAVKRAQRARRRPASAENLSVRREIRIDHLDRIERERERIFVNCWTAASGESHAMWSLYCASKEGVAVQTTLEKLQTSLEGLTLASPRLERVRYVETMPPDCSATQLALRKLPPFAYEKEWRIIHVEEDRSGGRLIRDFVDLARSGSKLKIPPSWFRVPPGFEVPWSAEKNIEQIFIHPGADSSFSFAVRAAVRALKPTLLERIKASGLADAPPRSR